MRISQIVLVIGILMFGLYLRLHTYDLYPQRGATSDEYAFAFLGVSLLTKGEPVSWSAIPLYINRTNLTIDKLYFPIVTPYLDHPPLFGVLIGIWSILHNQRSFDSVKLETIRVVPLSLSIVSLLLVYILSKKLYGHAVAVLAATIYAITPVTVINSRIVVAESILIVCILALLILYSHKKKQNKSMYLTMGAMSGIAILSKVLGVFVGVTVLILSFIDRTAYHKISIFIYSFLVAIAFFFFYGWYFGGPLFYKIQLYQGGRIVGPQTLWTILTAPIIVNTIYYDGWYYVGLLSLFVSCFFWKKHRFIVIPSLVYLLLLLASMTQTDIHGWYMLPLYPFMAIATSSVIIESIKKRSILFVIIITCIGMTLIQQFYEKSFGLTPQVFRFLLGILILPCSFVTLFGSLRLYKTLSYGYLFLLLLGTSYVTYTYVHPA